MFSAVLVPLAGSKTATGMLFTRWVVVGLQRDSDAGWTGPRC